MIEAIARAPIGSSFLFTVAGFVATWELRMT
jgi:hypothetical protein